MNTRCMLLPLSIASRNFPILGQPPPAPPRPRRCELSVAHNAQLGSGQRTLPISPTVDARRWADAVVEAGLGSRPRTQVARRPGPRGTSPRLRTLTPAGARCRTPFLSWRLHPSHSASRRRLTASRLPLSRKPPSEPRVGHASATPGSAGTRQAICMQCDSAMAFRITSVVRRLQNASSEPCRVAPFCVHPTPANPVESGTFLDSSRRHSPRPSDMLL